MQEARDLAGSDIMEAEEEVVQRLEGVGEGASMLEQVTWMQGHWKVRDEVARKLKQDLAAATPGMLYIWCDWQELWLHGKVVLCPSPVGVFPPLF
eukprot:9796350-Prorocentrum_lima.AAC.1